MSRRDMNALLSKANKMDRKVTYEARYETLCGGVEYPVIDNSGQIVSGSDPREVLRRGNQFVPLHCIARVISLKYSEATGCYESF